MRKNIYLIIAWFVTAVITVTVAMHLISLPHELYNILGCVLLFALAVVSDVTKLFTRFASKEEKPAGFCKEEENKTKVLDLQIRYQAFKLSTLYKSPISLENDEKVNEVQVQEKKFRGSPKVLAGPEKWLPTGK